MNTPFKIWCDSPLKEPQNLVILLVGSLNSNTKNLKRENLLSLAITRIHSLATPKIYPFHFTWNITYSNGCVENRLNWANTNQILYFRFKMHCVFNQIILHTKNAIKKLALHNKHDGKNVNSSEYLLGETLLAPFAHCTRRVVLFVSLELPLSQHRQVYLNDFFDDIILLCVAHVTYIYWFDGNSCGCVYK